jgi:hypothetical protein
MDRIASLIQKLQEAHQNKDNASVLLPLVNELQSLVFAQIQPVVQSGKRVAVILPNSLPVAVERVEEVDIPAVAAAEEEKIVEELQIDPEEVEEELRQIREKAAFASQMQAKQPKLTPGLLFDDEDELTEVPTFVHQPGAVSVSSKKIESKPETSESSLNDQLATPKEEVADQLGASPIKDLRKGIGINDRFMFINELFRGDESMYERSIKTINNFTIYAEAQYWIERELKVKLGWDNEKSVTQDFYALVRRRFG